MIQGNVPRAGLDFNAQRRAILDNHVRQTLKLADDIAADRSPRPTVVLWPENSSDIDPFTNADAATQIQRAADAIDAPILVGAVVNGPGDSARNMAIMWWPNGTDKPGPGQTYIKRHPAPFAEYVPYRDFFCKITPMVDLVPRTLSPASGSALSRSLRATHSRLSSAMSSVSRSRTTTL